MNNFKLRKLNKMAIAGIIIIILTAIAELCLIILGYQTAKRSFSMTYLFIHIKVHNADQILSYTLLAHSIIVLIVGFLSLLTSSDRLRILLGVVALLGSFLGTLGIVMLIGAVLTLSGKTIINKKEKLDFDNENFILGMYDN